MKKTFSKAEKANWKEQQKEKTREEMEGMIDALLNAENIGGFLEKTLFKMPDTVPAAHWSTLNQFRMFLAGTADARGIHQWNEAGRKLKKGCKAARIMIPCFKKFTDTDEKTGEKVEKSYIAYFKFVPVFRVEDTEGEPLDYEKELSRIRSEFRIEDLPLIDIARELNIDVSYNLSSGGAYGYYSAKNDLFGNIDDKKISLSTDAEQTFFHELSHAIDHQLQGADFNKDKSMCEIVAEFTGCFLAGKYGTTEANLKYTREYVRSWSKGKPPVNYLFKALERAAAIVDFISSRKGEYIQPESEAI